MNILNSRDNQCSNSNAFSLDLSAARVQVSINVFSFLLDAMRGQVFMTCIELGILDLIEDKKSIDQISCALNISHSKLITFLNTLTSMGVLKKTDGKFVINPLYNELLIRHCDNNMVETVLHLHRIRNRSSADIIDILTDDVSQKVTQPFASAEFWNKASDNLLSFHKSVMAQSVLSALEDSIDLDRLTKMMDLGAGSEVLAQLLTTQYPNLTVYIQDQAPLIQSIKQRLSKPANTGNKNSQHIHFVAGDYNDVEFPQSLDLVLSSMSLYYAADTLSLIQKIFDTLAPKGIFVSLHEGLSNPNNHQAT